MMEMRMIATVIAQRMKLRRFGRVAGLIGLFVRNVRYGKREREQLAPAGEAIARVGRGGLCTG
jgi:hypothetical protein